MQPCKPSPRRPAVSSYDGKFDEGHAKDCEFSGTSMREHWDMSIEDTTRTLRHIERLLPPLTDDAVAIHDLHREDPV